MFKENEPKPQLTREERIEKRNKERQQRRIKDGTLVDTEKKIVKGTGQAHIQNLLDTITNKDEKKTQKVLLQIGCDIHTIMEQEDMPQIEDIGNGEFKINCLTGTAGQRGLLRINDNNIKLNFPNLDDKRYNSKPSMKEAVESLFGVSADNNTCIIDIGQVE